jgi:hypothetical protein
MLTRRSARSHFIFDKNDGKLIDIAIKVKPADEYVLPYCFFFSYTASFPLSFPM